MERKRKCILTQLKGLLDIIDEDDGRRTCGDGDADTFVRNSTVSQELYPTCPVLKQSPSPRNESCSFQSTLREQNYPLVPYYDSSSCDDRNCSCDNKKFQYRPPKLHSLNGQCVPHRNCQAKSPQCSQCLPPKYIDQDYQYCFNKAPTRMDPYGSEHPRRRKALKSTYNCVVPARYAQSKELRGGKTILGCDCDKTNGLQDKCPRFCCIKNPKCKHRPAACYLSQYSGGKHLPNVDHRINTSTYNNFDKGSGDTIRARLLKLIDEIVSPTHHEVNVNPSPCCRQTTRRYHPYVHDNAHHSDYSQENYHDISFPSDCSRLCTKMIPYEMNDMPSRCCCPNYCAVNTPDASYHRNFHEYPTICQTNHCDCYTDW